MKIYVCKKCGNVVLRLEDNFSQVQCCGSPMELLNVNTIEGISEKHLTIKKSSATFYE